MRRRLMSSARPVAGGLAVLLALAWATPPAAAAEVAPNVTRAPLSSSVASQVAALKPTPRAFQTPTGTPGETDSRSFLKTKTGVFAVVVMTVGLGFAVRSAFKDNDVVHSPIR